MDEKIFQIPAYIVRDKSLMGGARQFVIETNESLTPELLQRLISLENQPGFFTFAVRQIDANDLIDLPDIDKSKFDISKSPSKRLRDIIYILYMQNSVKKGKGKKEDFELFYIRTMEKIIEHYKIMIDKD